MSRLLTAHFSSHMHNSKLHRLPLEHPHSQGHTYLHSPSLASPICYSHSNVWKVVDDNEFFSLLKLKIGKWPSFASSLVSSYVANPYRIIIKTYVVVRVVVCVVVVVTRGCVLRVFCFCVLLSRSHVL